MSTETNSLARITWSDPTSGTVKEFVLMEGATATIGRHASNDICIPEQHVSRQHAVINYRSGMFVLTDLGSANGTFLNDQQVAQPLPLVAGDVIRLYVPVLQFSALVSDDERREAERNGTLIAATTSTGKGKLIITNGPQEGNIIPLLLRTVRIGRATSKADWEIGLQDLSVSRPHARMELTEKHWMVYDLGSSNGTFVNDTPVNEKGRLLRDGDKVTFGNTVALFREA
ncbi:MAG TPA: FHA domain-containing protein [Aggregatilineales bacterium]|nr:FHA domain-containing protein [Anaerolineae bacterium]HUN05907.1 FHA domain-containing protein [Aggregatilineales bacterium]